jgi:energy-coupling factor transporter transmembrane protein EcfT
MPSLYIAKSISSINKEYFLPEQQERYEMADQYKYKINIVLNIIGIILLINVAINYGIYIAMVISSFVLVVAFLIKDKNIRVLLPMTFLSYYINDEFSYNIFPIDFYNIVKNIVNLYDYCLYWPNLIIGVVAHILSYLILKMCGCHKN